MNLAGNDWPWVAWTQLWQVTVLILAVALLLRCASRNRPQLACVLWLVVFLKCITPPLWSSPSGAFCWLQRPQTTLDKDSQGSLAVVVLPSDAAASSSRADANRPLPDTAAPTPAWRPDRLRPATWLTAIWIGGVVVMFGTIAGRWRRLARLVRQTESRNDPRWDALLAGLARRLRLPRRVRLVATPCAVGPAVWGLLHPTVLLPQAVTDGKPADEIELVLAHELIHVRRGDPWFALLRSLVLSVWWFHPLVWWAGRQASRAAERCCDEAVLAELRCSAARYARCLLDILAIKHQLFSVPAFPGVRAIEVTQGRLERIMKIGPGGCRRTPWWCWAVALLAAVAVIPGAALVISAGESPKAPVPAAVPASVPDPSHADAEPASSTPAHPAPDALAAGGGKPQADKFYRTYSVEDLLSKIRKEHDLSAPAAKAFLKDWVEDPWATPAVRGRGKGRRDPSDVAWHGDVRGNERRDASDVDCHAAQLVVRDTAEGHQRLAATLDMLREFGTLAFVVELRFVALGDKEFQQVLPESTMSPLTVDETGLAKSNAIVPATLDRPWGSHEGTHVVRAKLLIEKDSPVRFRIVDKKQGEKLIDRWQADKGAIVCQVPKVTLFNGQTAFVADSSQTPFVVGTIPVVGPFANAQKPQVRVISEGTTLWLRPVANRSDAVHLDFEATFSKIQAVDTATFNRTPTDGTTIQLPKVATVRMEGGATLKPGQWLLLGGPDSADWKACFPQTANPVVTSVSWTDWLVGGWMHQEPPKRQSLILMFRAEKVAADSQRTDGHAEHGHP
jgi:beta-lactamase regulating signal transducer with metallopeptidase domain